MKFSNSDIAVESLPDFAAIDFVHTREDYPLLWLRVTLCTYLLLLLVVAIPAFIFVPDVVELALYGPPRYISLVVLALASVQVWHGHRWAKIISYGVREHDVVLRSGVFWRKETVQPMKRLQHVEVVQGPIEKRVGLCKVKLFSAGTVNSTFVIPGLDQELGNRLREFVLAYRGPSVAQSRGDLDANTVHSPKPVSQYPKESSHDAISMASPRPVSESRKESSHDANSMAAPKPVKESPKESSHDANSMASSKPVSESRKESSHDANSMAAPKPVSESPKESTHNANTETSSEPMSGPQTEPAEGNSTDKLARDGHEQTIPGSHND